MVCMQKYPFYLIFILTAVNVIMLFLMVVIVQKTCTSATIKQSASSGEISLRKTCNAQKAISSKVVCSTKTNILELRKCR